MSYDVIYIVHDNLTFIQPIFINNSVKTLISQIALVNFIWKMIIIIFYA